MVLFSTGDKCAFLLHYVFLSWMGHAGVCPTGILDFNQPLLGSLVLLLQVRVQCWRTACLSPSLGSANTNVVELCCSWQYYAIGLRILNSFSTAVQDQFYFLTHLCLAEGEWQGSLRPAIPNHSVLGCCF